MTCSSRSQPWRRTERRFIDNRRSAFNSGMVHLGTSGWQYAHWKRVFYPEKLPQREWLPYYAERFQTVEVNNTFYNLPEKSVFAAWAARTPPDFCLALKMSRY